MISISCPSMLVLPRNRSRRTRHTSLDPAYPLDHFKPFTAPINAGATQATMIRRLCVYQNLSVQRGYNANITNPREISTPLVPRGSPHPLSLWSKYNFHAFSSGALTARNPSQPSLVTLFSSGVQSQSLKLWSSESDFEPYRTSKVLQSTNAQLSIGGSRLIVVIMPDMLLGASIGCGR
jgi:hypothetical protein